MEKTACSKAMRTTGSSSGGTSSSSPPSPIPSFCYCLMPNHIHFLLQLKEEQELTVFFQNNYQGRYPKILKTYGSPGNLASKQFSNLFSSYAQAFNKQEKRMGNLFISKFKRKPVTNREYLLSLVHYIHFNPVKAGLCRHPKDWEHSSFKGILSEKTTLLAREELLEWFDGKENFWECHTKGDITKV